MIADQLSKALSLEVFRKSYYYIGWLIFFHVFGYGELSPSLGQSCSCNRCLVVQLCGCIKVLMHIIFIK